MTRRPSLQSRTALLMAAVVTIAVVVAGLVTLGLVRSAAQTESRKSLRANADLVAAVVDAGRPRDITPVLRAVRTQATPVAWVGPGGREVGDQLARTAYASLSQESRQTPGSHTIQVRGRTVLVEVRPAGGATLVFAARPSLANAASLAVVRRALAALAIGLLVAVLAAAVFSRRLAAPLLRTADAAHRLAAGERSVRVEPEGPREVAEVGESLNVLGTALAHSERRQREFLMSVSHELRTPLTAIRGFGEALADGITSGDAVRPAGQTIVAEAERLERLVSDLLDLARLGADDFRYAVAPVDLRALASDAATVWAERCRREGVVFAVELPATEVPATTDGARLRQAIDGLAENALRVTPAGRPLVLALRAEGPDAVIEVRDGGPGLTDDDMAVAFERSELYDRYRGVRRVGTGLGLALVRALVTGLGGSVSVQQAREGGTCFAVRVPRQPQPPVSIQ